MKIKFKSQSELAAAASIIRQLFDVAVQRARQFYKDGNLTQEDLHQRMVTLHLLDVANDCYARTVMPRKQHCIKLTGPEGLALLSAWYSTDNTELDMEPQGLAVISDIAEQLEKTLCGPTVLI